MRECTDQKNKCSNVKCNSFNPSEKSYKSSFTCHENKCSKLTKKQTNKQKTKKNNHFNEKWNRFKVIHVDTEMASVEIFSCK